MGQAKGHYHNSCTLLCVCVQFALCIKFIQRSPLFCAPGLVKFVAAVARLFRLALPGSFLNVLAQNKGDLCT